jgi:hypothetical protein
MPENCAVTDAVSGGGGGGTMLTRVVAGAEFVPALVAVHVIVRVVSAPPLVASALVDE